MFKKIIRMGVFGVSALSVIAAHASGIYVTGQAGYANNHLGKHLTQLFQSRANGESPGFTMNNIGLAGRLAIGYQVNPYFATELGYLRLENQKGRAFDNPPPYLAPATETLKQNAIDVAAKGILPVTDKLNVYGKLGVAYLTSTITSHFGDVKDNQNAWFGVKKHIFAPEAAVGASYNLTPNVFVDTSLTHIQTIGYKHKPGNIDFATVGIGYTFG
ncbi:outer membrane beta-barrel protein [Rickettsiella grylli]|uniref:Outer membrane protein OmpA-like transmembrane domain-containing protein n=1 Tax=Rickettsiella grylli TaxID=59196 RepID=A8PMM1_9COXI|nr:outer membrane beta-barrel protein [Rickettsiella grylli]EDP46001.1 hypothetical protein RICGR_0767 [Rickettsiella grylli]